ncbi:uncharacterized protein TM35_000052500 [Trypanosoma theileri]|uniref:Uncharacterized protein n=1 Tax=Trypanosoma theileri TaxID=67003 RepID=A0A1X0P3Y9_9TRYP|nr:uncharacterized protein TM35_000052500 [Trypanosoma theileri]ORC91654.1 hypothetical protein TM35_000052500 [Trypanosoma theileri]
MCETVLSNSSTFECSNSGASCNLFIIFWLRETVFSLWLRCTPMKSYSFVFNCWSSIVTLQLCNIMYVLPSPNFPPFRVDHLFSCYQSKDVFFIAWVLNTSAIPIKDHQRELL